MRKSILRAQTRAVIDRGAVFHASAVRLDQVGILFLAPSGGGKSTIAQFLGSTGLDVLGDDSSVVSRGTDGIWRVIPCASWKWRREADIRPAPLLSLVFIEKGEPEALVRIEPGYAMYRILRDRLLMSYMDISADERPILRNSVMRICMDHPSFILRWEGNSIKIDFLNMVK